MRPVVFRRSVAKPVGHAVNFHVLRFGESLQRAAVVHRLDDEPAGAGVPPRNRPGASAAKTVVFERDLAEASTRAAADRNPLSPRHAHVAAAAQARGTRLHHLSGPAAMKADLFHFAFVNQHHGAAINQAFGLGKQVPRHAAREL